MPTPTLIDANGDYTTGGTPGVWQIGTALFVISKSIADTKIHCFTSLDSGATWNELDSANAPSWANNEGWASTSDGAQFLWAVFDNVGLTDITVISFDTIAGTWGNPHNPAIGATTGFTQVAFRPSDGNLIIGAFKNSLSSYAYTIFNTVAGTAPGWLSCGPTVGFTQNTLFGILQGTGSNTFWFYFLNQNGTSSQNISIQSLVGSALGVNTIIDSFASSTISPGFVSGYSDGLTMTLIWKPNHAIESLTVWTAPTSTMVFTSQTLSLGGDPMDLFGIAVSAATGIVVTVVDGNTDELDLFFDTGSGFGSLTPLVVLSNSPTLSFDRILNPALASGWAITFEDSNGINFLGGIAPPAPAPTGPVIIGALGVQNLPSIGAVCRFVTDKRKSNSPRTMIAGKLITYPGYFVRN